MALFDLEPGTPPERTTTPVAKTFRRFERDQVLLLPPSLEEWLPADHLARFVAELVDGVLDLSGIYADYTEARGDPTIITTLPTRRVDANASHIYPGSFEGHYGDHQVRLYCSNATPRVPG